jgi:cAMP-dependent protein kinase regulator
MSRCFDCFKKKTVAPNEEQSVNITEPPRFSSAVSSVGETVDEAEEERIAQMYKAKVGTGRKSVSAERYDPTEDDLDDMTSKVVPKSDIQRKRLQQAASKIMLLNRLDEEQLQKVLDAMEERKVSSNEVVIQQGDDGDNFYIIESGTYDILIGDNKVGSYNETGFFGELALMYNMPRAATIKAVSAGTLWSLDRATFRQIIVRANAIKRKQFEDFIKSVEILEDMTETERSKIADVMETKKFSEKEVIIKQGDIIDSSSFVYFLMSGTVAVTIKDESSATEKVVKKLEKGSYFGELALLTREPRKATITVVSPDATAGVLDVNAFERLLGPCKEIMSRKVDQYAEEIANLKIDTQ